MLAGLRFRHISSRLYSPLTSSLKTCTTMLPATTTHNDNFRSGKTQQYHFNALKCQTYHSQPTSIRHFLVPQQLGTHYHPHLLSASSPATNIMRISITAKSIQLLMSKRARFRYFSSDQRCKFYRKWNISQHPYGQI